MPSEDQVFAQRGVQMGGGTGSLAGGVAGSSPELSRASGGVATGTTSRSEGGAFSISSLSSANKGGTSSSSGTISSGGFDAKAGLLAHFAFDESTGSVAINSANSAKSGSYVGSCTHPTGRIGGAVGLRNLSALTETTEWLELPAGLVSGLSATTMSLWVRDLSPTRDGARLFDFSLGATEEIYFAPSETNSATSATGGHLGGTHAGAAFVDLWVNSPDFTDKVWHHVAFAWSAAAIELYVDGKMVGSKASPGVTPSDLGVTSPNWLGRSLNDKFLALYAEIDELRLYSRALSASDILQLYNLR